MTKQSIDSHLSRLISIDSVIYITILFGILLRFANLDADPYSRIWIGYITDEGFWNANARNALLFGKPFFDFSNLHFFIAPVFQSINYLFFLALDISYSSARSFPALCGVLLILLYLVFFRNVLSRESIFFAITFIAFQPELLMLSRISIPEAPLMLVELLLFFLISLPSRNLSTYFLFVLVLLFGISIKATFLPLTIILTCALIGTPGHNFFSNHFSDKNCKNMLYFAGIVLSFTILAAGAFFYLDDKHIAALPIATILRYLKINSLFSILSFPVYDPIAPTFNFLALGVWFSFIGKLHLDKNNSRGFRLHQLFTPALIWFALYLALMTGLGYFPERYKVHIFIPMIIIISVGMSILNELEFDKLLRCLSKKLSWKLFYTIGLYSLPSSVLFAIFVKYGLQSGFGIADRFILRLLSIGIAFTVVFAVTVKLRYRKNFVVFLLVFPLIAITIWYLGYHFQDRFPFWLPIEHTLYSNVWMAVLASSFGLSILFSIFFKKAHQLSIGSTFNLVTTMLLATLLVWVVPLYSNPRFTIRETSRDLGKLLQGSPSVGVLNSYGLFLENRIEYMPQIKSKSAGFHYPQDIVSVFDDPHVKKVRQYLDQDYTETKAYYLDIYPYPDLNSRTVKVSVYKKI